MAGVDDGYTGEARLTPGFTVGLLAQEPQLDPAKDVLGNVMDGVGRGARRCSTATTRSWPSGPTPTPTTRRSARSRPSSRTRSTPPTPGTSTATSRSPWTRCAARPTTPTSPRSPAASAAGWRCAACCSSQPDLLLLDEPTNHLDAESVAWLERFLQDYHGTVVAITHDRYFLDNVARWILELDRGRGFPFEGNYSSWLEQKQARLRPGGEAELGPPAHPRARAGVGAHGAQGPPGQGQGPPRRPTRSCWPRPRPPTARPTGSRSPSRPGQRLGDMVIEVEHLRKGYGDRLLIEDLSFTLPRAGIVGVIGPNGAGKTTLFRMLTGAGGSPTPARSRIGETVELAYVDQSRDALDADNTVYEEITGGART